MSRFRDEWATAAGMTGWFSERGYRLTDRRGPEGMNQGLHRYEGERLDVQITADRSQWFIEIRLKDAQKARRRRERWFDLELVSACLGNPVEFHGSEGSVAEQIERSWTLQPQIDYLRDNMDKIEALAEEGRASESAACLQKAQKARAAKLWS